MRLLASIDVGLLSKTAYSVPKALFLINGQNRFGFDQIHRQVNYSQNLSYGHVSEGAAMMVSLNVWI